MVFTWYEVLAVTVTVSAISVGISTYLERQKVEAAKMEYEYWAVTNETTIRGLEQKAAKFQVLLDTIHSQLLALGINLPGLQSISQTADRR